MGAKFVSPSIMDARDMWPDNSGADLAHLCETAAEYAMADSVRSGEVRISSPARHVAGRVGAGRGGSGVVSRGSAVVRRRSPSPAAGRLGPCPAP
ncbi:hypothetical protein [Micromonospora avicenniae]|uniref:hypothetical protein n=1 Tax=Micromonospora avicenniae TaxID=1198245 RepID=UPI001FEB7F23|nr:hypothetical protein [Micromonospora avicenniae]